MQFNWTKLSPNDGCDLHPRWSPSGRFVTVDSIDDGHRGVYLLELPSKIDW